MMANVEAKELENGERLAKLEQKVDNIERIANKIDNNFETFTNIFVPRTEIQLMFDSRDKEISNIRGELKEKATKEELQNTNDKISEAKQEKQNWWKSVPVWIGVAVGIATIIFSTYVK